MNTIDNLDIAICGAGPVGMALAALLVQQGAAPQRVGLLDAKTLAQASDDPRSIALSHGSRQILERIGAWPIAATGIEQIHVSRRGRFGRSLIDRAEHGVEALGYVACYGAVVTALGAVCAQLGVATLRPALVRGAAEDGDAVTLTLDEGAAGPRALRAALVVQAEGGLFGDQQERAVRRDYRQSAIIAQIQVSAMQARRAFERFTDDGPLALLPQGDSYALVWCVPPARAAQLLALDDAAFLAQLGLAFGGRLGRFTATSARFAYPLGLNAGPAASARSVAIGNAAQTLHPVAGQGMNLGLRDAAVLARLLARDASPAALAQFAAQRQPDRDLTVRLTDTMARAFTGGGPLQTLLGASLGLIDAVGPARRLLAELMMYGRR
ncbi:FAD-dependent monooxygenase [Janthinobacterium fluminis]|uniref:FAD-dependent monooxygenase n=1 Tax=Janthinobacterium fluminis TaxID=2987524 RepID=A0ABT5K3D1_9BURK|nr:FAD-dependent monooxygenase [Janthinobacterium fluminis]MDC8759481.1 FAD-dependent monooxygenase [Janthinobacterium fluminis]